MNIISLRSFCSTFAIAILGIIAWGLPVQANVKKSDLAIAQNQPDATIPIVQTDTDIDVQPGRTTRSGSSYFGLGGNIGLSGDHGVGDGAFAVISKIGLTRSFSVRPSAVINDEEVFMIPLTIDFNGNQFPLTEVNISPYLGGGLAISTEDDNTIGGLITGGLDIPLTSQFTANTSINVGFFDDTDVGLQLGAGLNF
jgi:hypothetical protein